MEEDRTRRAPFFGISRLRIGMDGQGITTLVGFMGCPLHCAYCINDQCHDAVYEDDGVTPMPGVMLLSPRELYEKVKQDNIYFQATGGGICFGGGEPSEYAWFIEEFRKICPPSWKITVETATCSPDTFADLKDVVDAWILDIKSLNQNIRNRYAGSSVGNVREILDCIRQLHLQDKVTVKVPLIPGFSDKRNVDEDANELQAEGFKNVARTIYYNHQKQVKHEKG